MSTVDPAIHRFAESLAETIRQENVARFRSYLQGGFLPAIGGDAPPPEILLRSLALLPDYSAAAKGSARLLAHVLRDEAGRLESPGATLTVEHKHLLLDGLRLAAALPTQAQLFHALWKLRHILVGSPQNSDQFLLPILDALVFQQVDDTLEDLWLRYLDALATLDRPWKPLEQETLFISWRGLLWIPPQGKSEVIHFARLDRGLRAVSRAIAQHDDGPRMLRHALNVLSETYPRSAGFWTERLTTWVSGWPAVLQHEAYQKWPGLRRITQSAAPARPRPALATTYVQPQTELERRIASVWTEILGVDPVGVHDNFFDLGGDSLSCVQLVRQLREQLGTGLSETSLFEAPSVGALARMITARGSGDDSVTVTGVARGRHRKARLQSRWGAA